MLNLAIASERQKLAYFDTLSNRTDRTISLHAELAPNDASARDLAAQVILQRKGRVLDAMAGSLAALRQRLNAEDQKLLDQLNATTAQFARLALGGRGQMPADEYQKQLAARSEQKEQFEAEISRRSAEFRAQSQPVTLAAVRAAVPEGAALVEFAAYRPFDPKIEPVSEAFGEPRYVAYAIRSRGEVEWKELGPAREIDARIDALRQALSDPRRADVRQLGRAVDERVFQPLRPLPGETRQLLVSPDGELNLLPFAALVDERGNFLLERYSFTYLTSGRDLSTVNVTIIDNDATTSASNPVDSTDFFVRQHYVDFLNRAPDASGFAFWTNNINSCASDGCRDARRIETSAAFFLSIESQQTGFLVEKTYQSAFNRVPGFREFIRDTQAIGQGVVIGQPGADAQLEANKQSFFAAHVARTDFLSVYAGLSNDQYVDALNANTGGSLTASERGALVSGLGGRTETRATVLRKVAENAAFTSREFNRAFVLMQYFGYLLRDPDSSGFNLWLQKLNQFGGDFRRAEMVKAFLSSTEYRQRFGQP